MSKFSAFVDNKTAKCLAQEFLKSIEYCGVGGVLKFSRFTSFFRVRIPLFKLGPIDLKLKAFDAQFNFNGVSFSICNNVLSMKIKI